MQVFNRCRAHAPLQISSIRVLREVVLFEKILVPVDLTENELTMSALSAAEVLATKFDSAVHIVNIQSLLPIAMIDYVPENFDEEIKLGLEKEITAIASKCHLPKRSISTAILFGPIYQTILEEAESWGADLLIFGSHRPGMERFLVGSNAGAIVRHATCSVLVIR